MGCECRGKLTKEILMNSITSKFNSALVVLILILNLYNSFNDMVMTK